MNRPRWPFALSVLLLCCLSPTGCPGGDVPVLEPPDVPPIYDVDVTDTWELGGLSNTVHVVTTGYGVPHVYAHDEEDLARVVGFISARDRYFMMDLARRLMRGQTAALIGDDALTTDIESRTTGTTRVLDQLMASLTEDERARLQAYADGVNAYIDAVVAGELPAPSELDLAAGLLGADEPTDLMLPFAVEDVASVGSLVLYESSYETTPLSYQRTLESFDGLFAGAPLEELRREGARNDIFENHVPAVPISSANGWGVDGEVPDAASQQPSYRGLRAETGVLDRAIRHGEHLAQVMGRPYGRDRGSNSWALGPEHTESGHALLGSDGHLDLTIPSFFIRLHTNTTVLGDGELDVIGITVPGMPLVGQGHNGRVAWGQTQHSGDINDYYLEQLTLDGDGAPASTLFQGDPKDVVAVAEQYESAAVPLLGSEGGSFTIDRYETWDGRALVSVEGIEVDPDDVTLEPGESLINVMGDWLVPGDVDGDGIVQAISHDYAATDGGNLLRAVDAFGRADDAVEFREAMRGLVAYSQNIVVADSAGNVFYSGYEAIPCRSYLPRNDDGTWIEGADPRFLLDGTAYAGFEIPLTEDGVVDESFADDPYRCVVPFDEYPQAFNPASGYVITANQDPGGMTLDGDIFDEDWYIGGPWNNGFRAGRIDGMIQRDSGTATLETLVEQQADHYSVLGEIFAPYLLEQVEYARQVSDQGATEGADGRIAALYDAESARIEAAAAYLEDWEGLGYLAESGVETVYNEPDADELRAAVATSIYNAWYEAWRTYVLEDEGLPSVFKPTGRGGRARALDLFVRGIGPGNPLGLASYNEETEESAFFDVLSTVEIETSQEVALMALVDALDFWASEPGDDFAGGVGSDDPEDWLWGLRHMVRFSSVLGEFLDDDDPMMAVLLADFSISPDLIPLDTNIPDDDPRADLPGFPRHGDYFNVDSGNPGGGGPGLQYGDGPVMRFAVELDPAGFRAVNVIPGGQSALTDSDHFADQIPLWLANEASPCHFAVDDVAANAVGRELFQPGE